MKTMTPLFSIVIASTLLIVPGTSHAINWKFWKNCQTVLTADSNDNQSTDLAESLLDVLEPGDPLRESRTRLLGTMKDMKKYQAELFRMTAAYATLSPQLAQRYEALQSRATPENKDKLEETVLSLEMILDQLKDLADKMNHAVQVKIVEMKAGVTRNPELFEGIPREWVDRLMNPKDAADSIDVLKKITAKETTEKSVAEELQVILYFEKLRQRFSTVATEGFAPGISLKLKAAHRLLGHAEGQ